MSIFPTRVLLATDGSEEASSATEAAAEISEKTGSELHVIHVYGLAPILEVRVRSEVPSDTVPRGQVIEQSPEAGTEVEASSLVNITVSSGPQRQPFLLALAGSWWAPALRGLEVVIFGLAISFPNTAIFDPGIGDFQRYAALMMMADGLFAIIDATTRASRRLPLLIQGIIGGSAGLLTLIIGALEIRYVPAYLVGCWAIFIGIIRIIAAIQLWAEPNIQPRRKFKVVGLLIISSVSLLAFGILAAWPSSYPWQLLGILALASGITLMTFAFRAWSQERSMAAGRTRT